MQTSYQSQSGLARTSYVRTRTTPKYFRRIERQIIVELTVSKSEGLDHPLST